MIYTHITWEMPEIHLVLGVSHTFFLFLSEKSWQIEKISLSSCTHEQFFFSFDTLKNDNMQLNRISVLHFPHLNEQGSVWQRFNRIIIDRHMWVNTFSEQWAEKSDLFSRAPNYEKKNIRPLSIALNTQADIKVAHNCGGRKRNNVIKHVKKCSLLSDKWLTTVVIFWPLYVIRHNFNTCRT
jgi:hypothetical protein